MTPDPNAGPDNAVGLPRLVIEAHARLGGNATPQQVADDLRARGVETTVDDVRAVWPEGGNLTG